MNDTIKTSILAVSLAATIATAMSIDQSDEPKQEKAPIFPPAPVAQVESEPLYEVRSVSESDVSVSLNNRGGW